MVSLFQLSACYNEIEDMSPVGFLQNLKLLHLIDNVINKITGLLNHPLISIAVISLYIWSFCSIT